MNDLAGVRYVAPVPRTTRTHQMGWRRAALPYLFIAPAVVLVAVIVLFPLGYSFWLSFMEWNTAKVGTVPVFIGLRNYAKAFQDERFHAAIKTSLTYGVLALIAEQLLAFPLALVLNSDIKGMRIITSIFIIPTILAPIGVGVLWRLLYNPDVSPFNWMIRVLGLGSGPMWVGDAKIALACVSAVEVWRSTPFVMLCLLAGLKSMPSEPYEAASIDGANALQTFRYLTLPFLSPVIVVVLIFRTMGVLNTFDLVYVLTGGGPGGLTEVIGLYVFKTGFKYFRVTYASALSWVLMGATGLLSAAFITLMNRQIEV